MQQSQRIFVSYDGVGLICKGHIWTAPDLILNGFCVGSWAEYKLLYNSKRNKMGQNKPQIVYKLTINGRKFNKNWQEKGEKIEIWTTNWMKNRIKIEENVLKWTNNEENDNKRTNPDKISIKTLNETHHFQKMTKIATVLD